MANVDTGEMLNYEDIVKKPKEEQKKFKPVPPEFIKQMESMNRKQRRNFMRLHKKEFKQYEQSLAQTKANK